MKTLSSLLTPLALLLLLTVSSVQALQLVIWDPQLQTKLGYGEVVGSKLNLQLVPDYSGPVVALFSRDDTDKNAYAGLMPRYSGQLRGSVLSLEDSGSSLSLGRFLAPYKLTPNIQSAGRVSLPGLKTPLPKVPAQPLVPSLPVQAIPLIK